MRVKSRKAISGTIATHTHKIKCLQIQPTKEVKDLYNDDFKMLLKEIR